MARAFGSIYAIAVAAVLCSTAAPTPRQNGFVNHDEDHNGDDCADHDDVVEEFGTDFIQQQRKILPPTAEQAGLSALVPITWVHVPRTGDSFAYTLLTMKALCGRFVIPDDRSLKQVKVIYVKMRCSGITVDDRCPSQMNYGECAETSIGGAQYDKAKGRVVGFFRHPETRLLSDYHDSIAHGGSANELDLAEWMSSYLGCHTKKLTWDGNGVLDGDWHCEGAPPTWDEVDLAKEIVQNDYIFIGVTDEWNLSICLFNKMFGNSPSAVQFQDYGVHTTNTSNELSEFNGFEDPYDTPVWDIALSIFKQNLVQYDVSDATCEVPSM